MVDYFRSVLAIPVTHCNNDTVQEESMCFVDDTMTCMATPNGSDPLNFNYRDRVYLGQFRTIRMYSSDVTTRQLVSVVNKWSNQKLIVFVVVVGCTCTW